MAKTSLSKLHELAARVDKQLHYFEDEPDGDEAAGVSMPEMRKKKNPLLRAGMAGATVAGAATIAANKDKIKAGAQRGKAAVTEAGKTAAFKGMRATAKGMNTAGNTVKKYGADTVGDALKKGAKKLKKGSMKFFSADLARQLVRIEGKVRRFEAR